MTRTKPQDLADDAVFPCVYPVIALQYKHALHFTKSCNTLSIVYVRFSPKYSLVTAHLRQQII